MTYIWDLDGTLIDSYPGILDALTHIMNYFHNSIKKEDVYSKIMQKSVLDFLNEIEEKYNINSNETIKMYSDYREKTQFDVSLEKYAKETLVGLKKRGHNHFIYTHKGWSTSLTLKNLGIYHLFTEVDTAEYHFKRKPDPEAIEYILNKYHINPKDCYYVGDRPIDILCAKNANIKGILYKKEGSPIDITADFIILNLNDLL
jgi:HAD superfamily hydrolase (TIGR01549 family)